MRINTLRFEISQSSGNEDLILQDINIQVVVSHTPTISPTTSLPTVSPTTEPTTSPTTVPTEFPTTCPTTCPTSVPTLPPTTTPTTEPTSGPSLDPTIYLSPQEQINELIDITETLYEDFKYQQEEVQKVQKENEELRQEMDEMRELNYNLIDTLDFQQASLDALQKLIRDSYAVNEDQDVYSFKLRDDIDDLQQKDFCEWEGTSCSCASDTGFDHEGYIIISTECIEGVMTKKPSVVSFVLTGEESGCPAESPDHLNCDVWSIDYDT
eukprot:UN06958